MKLTVCAVGTRMPSWVDRAWKEYAQRFSSDYKIDLKEIKAQPRTSGMGIAQTRSIEARRIKNVLPAHSLYIALDERGIELTSIALSQSLEKWRINSQHVAFIIGGADGLDDSLKNLCSEHIRLSSLTLPHALVRILLVEQLYRAWTILNHHPYHRD